MLNQSLQKDHLTLTSSRDIQEICQPLFSHLQLNFFRFLRLYPDGSRITLCSNAEWTEHFYQVGHHKVAWFDCNCPSIFSTSMQIWDSKILTEDNVVGVDARQNFNFFHGMTLIKNSVTHSEFYDFATFEKNHRINEIYEFNKKIFEHFILYFKDKAADIIEALEHNKLWFPIFNSKPVTLGEDELVDLFSQMPIDRYYILEDTYLTKREMECLQWIIKGKSASEIGLILSLSQRTIEEHINHLKTKFGCYKITSLVQKASIALSRVELI